MSNITWSRCGSLGFQTAAEEPVFAACCDDVRADVWELIFYLLPRVFGLFVKGDVDVVDATSCVESAVVGVSYCICDETEGFVLGYL